MIRPSALQIAEHCGLSARLAEQYPETSPAADRGTAIHADIAMALTTGKPAATPEGRAAVRWVKDTKGGEDLIVEQGIELRDPETDEVITAGTPDLVLLDNDGVHASVIDWKTGRPDHVPVPAENMQLMAYAAAVALKHDRPAVNGILVFLDGAETTTFAGQDWLHHWDLIERVRTAANRPAVASPGEHCWRCWSRSHCQSYRDRAGLALTTLQGSRELTLTDETAGELAVRIKAVREAADMAEELVKAHVRNGGRALADGKAYVPQTIAGRKTADVRELLADGLDRYVREGKPYERWSWMAAPKEPR